MFDEVLRMSDVVTENPLNRHVSWDGLEHDVTPTGEFFCRNHNEFPVPPTELDWAGTSLTVKDLAAFPQVEYLITLECAGNGRTEFHPVPRGTPWGIRGLSTGRFRGVSVETLLKAVPPTQGTEHVIFRGADVGQDGLYERSLSLEEIHHHHAFVALQMNGRALPPQHGAPFRLMVPNYFAMTSVKWLCQAAYSPTPSTGYYQVEDYLVDYQDGTPVRPATVMKPKSILVSPSEGEAVRGLVTVRGKAWTGEGEISGVELSVRGAGLEKLVQAQLGDDLGPFAWRSFHCELTLAAGAYSVASHCLSGEERQPEAARWNAQGYENNSAHRVAFQVV